MSDMTTFALMAGTFICAVVASAVILKQVKE